MQANVQQKDSYLLIHTEAFFSRQATTLLTIRIL